MSVAACIGVSAALVALVCGIGFGARAVWLGVSTARAVTDLPRQQCDPALVAAARSAGLSRVDCVVAAAPSAFTAGLVRPRVSVTSAAVTALDPQELQAVLVHESAHVRRRDPLRRVLIKAATDVVFFVPALRWWGERQRESSELAADRSAIERVGRKAVAGALLATATGGAPSLTAAFDAPVAARTAQLLDDPIPARPVPLRLVLLSFVGAVTAVSLLMCIGQTALTVLSR
nr:M56 family metallopeptidase [Amycolatopsis rhizosphaerae]